jgi:ribonuclease-3 family protein
MIETGFLTEDEERLLTRARNHWSMSRPQHADSRDYKYATGFEALIGYLHLTGRTGRIQEITAEAFRIIDSAAE